MIRKALIKDAQAIQEIINEYAKQGSTQLALVHMDTWRISDSNEFKRSPLSI